MTGKMPSRQDVVDLARDWIGTRFVHQGRRKGHGVDCVGLIKGVYEELGLLSQEVARGSQAYKGYSRLPDGRTMRLGFDRYLTPQNPQTLSAGSVGLFWVNSPDRPQHAGIITDLGGRWGIVHALTSSRRVVEHGLNEEWLDKLVQLYDYPGVSDG
jgi:cell wall-associated NlpC family hydrolase